jgi:hypothetical protein
MARRREMEMRRFKTLGPGGSGRRLLVHGLGDRVHTVQDALRLLLVGHLEAEVLLDHHHELQRVHGVEADACRAK